MLRNNLGPKKNPSNFGCGHAGSSLRARSFLVIACALLVFMTECTSRRPVRITAQPLSSLMDEPVHIEISGLPHGRLTSVQVHSRDSHGVDWASSATFKAGASGDLDLDRARSLSGSYRGINGMG